MKTILAAALVLFCSASLPAQKTEILIRCDDIGMCHTVNMAFEKVLQTGTPVSASVMFACPWYQEAVDILKKHPEVSVGIHLTLNAEWKNYRWGPVAGATAVPALVDSCGYFFPSREKLFANKPSMREIETELRAQINRALKTGLKVDYMDYHMGAAVQTAELRSLLERLASEYGLGISRWFGESEFRGAYAVDPAHKIDTLLAQLAAPLAAGVHLIVFHVGMESNEMGALLDMNSFGLSDMSKHRAAELGVLTSPLFRSTLQTRAIRPTTYRELIQRSGLGSMKRPVTGLD